MIVAPATRIATAWAAISAGSVRYTARMSISSGMPALDLATSRASGVGGPHPGYHAEQLVGPVAAVATDRVRAPRGQGDDRLLRRDAHHRVAAGVEGHRGDQRDANRDAPDTLDRRLDLGQVGHRLDPDQVHTTGHQGGGLLGKDVDGLAVVERAGRRHDRPARPDVSGDQCASPPWASTSPRSRIAAVWLISATRSSSRCRPESHPVPAECVGHDDLEPASR